MVKKILIVISIILAFILGGLGSNISIGSYPIDIDPKDAKMFQEAKLYLDTSAEYKSKNWWCSGVVHKNDSTFFYFWDGELPSVYKTKIFGLYEDIQYTFTSDLPITVAFYNEIWVGIQNREPF